MHSSLIQSLNGKTLSLQGNSYSYFSGTSYLGIAFHPEFQNYLVEGIQLFGGNYGGSRLSNLQFPVYEEAEQYLARFTNFEASITFSSGTLAGQLLSQYLSQTHELCYLPRTHPALQHQANTSNLEIKQILEKAKNTAKPIAIFANSIDPLYCTPTDFSWWQELPKNQKTVVVLDDSHGLGVIGESGAGVASILEIPEHIDLIISASLGKAYAIPGGVIFGDQEHVDGLKNSPLFGGASPIIPAYLHAFLKTKNLYQTQLKKLHKNVAQFVNGIQNTFDFRFLKQLPVFYTANQQLYEQLQAKGILISSFPYPSKASPRINRIVLSAAHEDMDIDFLLQALKRIQLSSNT